MVKILTNLWGRAKGAEGIAETHLERDKKESVLGFVEFKNP